MRTGKLVAFLCTATGMLFVFACTKQRTTTKMTKPPAPIQDLTYADGQTEATVVLAGGCFWCTEAVFKQLAGVTKVVPGYAGGSKKNADYYTVANGGTKHAECIQITYNPTKITYGKLLQIFFTTHDPTQLNRQGNDVGKHYRSSIFYANDKERQVAEAYIQQLKDAKVFTDSIVTTLEPLEAFYIAEKNHHDYAAKNPGDGYIRSQAKPKVKKVRDAFPDQVK